MVPKQSKRNTKVQVAIVRLQNGLVCETLIGQTDTHLLPRSRQPTRDYANAGRTAEGLRQRRSIRMHTRKLAPLPKL
jgi:hypothetical protein